MNLLQLPKKKLGQNFLIDQNIINKIVKIGNIDESKIVLEIGAGYGNLTKKLQVKNQKKCLQLKKIKKLLFI